MASAGRICTSLVLAIVLSACDMLGGARDDRPNFLIIVSDDQSVGHTSYAGFPHVATPNFDAVAERGVYFSRAHAGAPTCTASRGSMLTGQPIWQLRSGALLRGTWDSDFISFQHILAENGYRVGATAKGWSPGQISPELDGHPAGSPFLKVSYQNRAPELGQVDIAANFRRFLEQRHFGNPPFSFWAGPREPHRPYRSNPDHRFSDPAIDPQLPPVVPDTTRSRAEFAGYLDEIEVLDGTIGELLAVLDEFELSDNTVVIITSDNGMPFSRGKPQNYQLGVQVPLAIYRPGAQHNNDIALPVSLLDIAPTLLELAGIRIPEQMTGMSLVPLLQTAADAAQLQSTPRFVFSAYERHSTDARADGATCSRRALHGSDYLYIRNNFPERWPAGDPKRYKEAFKQLLVDPVSRMPMEPQYSLATARRPAEELYYLPDDPYQVDNLAALPEHAATLETLREALDRHLHRTGDPVALTGEPVFDQYR